jgi:hypothetical protein
VELNQFELVAVLCILLAGVPVAFAIGRVLLRLWYGPESEIEATLVPTEDPFNDRIEIFLSKD